MPTAILDTSVLVRYLTGDDPQRADAARKLIAAQPDDALLLPDVAVAELSWVLLRVYRWPPAQVARALRAVATHRSIEVPGAAVWLDVADDLERGCGLVDSYLQHTALAAGVATLLTFDTGIQPLAGVSCQSP